VDVTAAIERVLSDDPTPLHWTVIQDRALRDGYIDPFEVRDVRKQVLGALASMSKEGRVRRVSAGTYMVAGPHAREPS
jgi:predicted transcriptional regulator of viral defense system